VERYAVVPSQAGVKATLAIGSEVNENTQKTSKWYQYYPAMHIRLQRDIPDKEKEAVTLSPTA